VLVFEMWIAEVGQTHLWWVCRGALGPRVDMPSVAGTDGLFDERLRGMLRERVRDVLAKRFDLAGYVDPK